MRVQNITIDINKLNTDQLTQLAAMLYYTRQSSNDVKQINDRIAFISGWMSEKAEAAYIAQWC